MFEKEYHTRLQERRSKALQMRNLNYQPIDSCLNLRPSHRYILLPLLFKSLKVDLV